MTIAAGASSATVTVTPIDDSQVEGDETVVLTLASAAAYNIGAPASATVTIADNDGTPPPGQPVLTLSAADPDASESGPDVGVIRFHRTGDTWIDVGHARYMAEHIPNASYVELPGAEHRPWLGDVDAIADEIQVSLTGRKSRPRRRTNIGVDALSRREREVALLASRGETAQEIADHLFVSKRTVESHLVSIYAKLGVASKTELIRRASQLGI